jgi:hypothetical protein
VTKNYLKNPKVFLALFLQKRTYGCHLFSVFYTTTFCGVPRVILYEPADEGSSPPGQNPPTASVLPAHRSQPGFQNFQT